MKIARIQIVRLLLILGVLTWCGVLFALLQLQFNLVHQMPADQPLLLARIALSLLMFLVFLFFQVNIKASESLDVLDLLWKVFVTGMLVTLILLFSVKVFVPFLANHGLGENPYFGVFVYHVHYGIMLIFLFSCFVAWKRLVLYQKNRKLLMLWRAFEYLLFASLLLVFFDLQPFSALYDVVLGLLVLVSLVLALNLKWVPYLNFRQKWISILLMALITVYVVFILRVVFDGSTSFQLSPTLFANVTVIALFAFVALYALISILVTLFNLPTSSVVDQKFEEIINFQRLSQSRNTDHGEQQVFQILLESSVKAVQASAAWLEIQPQEGSREPQVLYYRIGAGKREEIEAKVDPGKARKLLSSDPVKNQKTNRYVANVQDSVYKCILVFPLYVQNRLLGSLTLLKDVPDSFTREMIEVLRTYVNQASISIENHRLLQEALENERYKEELKIAKRVQVSLIPEFLEKNDDFDISAYTRAAAEVGGDYYDTYRVSPDKVALIIGDVSGKGTSAAFHMSQMKGIFQSLVQIDLSARDFIIKANNALRNCLERTSFITTSYFVIDRSTRTMEFTRAGHCPTLIYKAGESRVHYLEDSGLGLGILRDEQFSQFVEVSRMHYEAGDILLLYTDGITEAKNHANEEFGFARLKEYLEQNAHRSVFEIEAGLIDDLLDFCGDHPPGDDITMLIVKFK